MFVEVRGQLLAWHGAGGFTLSAYFTSIEAARSGEKLPEFRSFLADIEAVLQETTYVDLADPWLSSSSRAVPVA